MSDNFLYVYKSGAQVVIRATEDDSVEPSIYTPHVKVDDLEMDGLGDTDDDAAEAGGEGSVSAKLRRISADINELLTLMPEEGAEAAAQELLNLHLQELDNRMTDGAQIAQMLGKIDDITFRVPRIDPSTHAAEGITVPHAEIHKGNSFHCHFENLCTNTGEQSVIAFNTPKSDKHLHLVVTGAGTSITRFSLIEAPSIDVGEGTQLTVRNRKRSSLKTSVVSSIETIPVVGVVTSFNEAQAANANITETNQLDSIVAGAPGANPAQGGVGGLERSLQEWELDEDTQYALIAESLDDSDNYHTIAANWYEHTDKD